MFDVRSKLLNSTASYEESVIRRRVSFGRFPLDGNSDEQSAPKDILMDSGEPKFL